MAITLGTFTKLDDGVFTGTLKTLNVTAALTIVPVDKTSDNGTRLPGLCRPALRDRRRLEPGREIERRDLHQPQDRGPRLCEAERYAERHGLGRGFLRRVAGMYSA